MLQQKTGEVDASERRDDPRDDSDTPDTQASLIAVDDATEDAYWREHYSLREYADETVGYDQYRPAFRYGWVSRATHAGRRWDQVERELQRAWREHRGSSRLGWNDAKLAARDAWQRIDRQMADSRRKEGAESDGKADG